jgi:hypothetical protein
MRRGFVRRRLRHGPLRWLAAGVAFLACFVPYLALCVLMALDGSPGQEPGELVGLFVMCGCGLAFGLGLIWWALMALGRLGAHPDLLALRRYGPVDVVLADIDAEVYGQPPPFRTGTLLRFYHLFPVPGDFRGHQVLITPSWLIHLWGEGGHRVEVVCLEDLVAAFRDPSVKREQIESRLVLLDRHNVRVQVPGTTPGVRSLLAEVQGRAPWALGFNPEVERALAEAPAKVAAELARRREIIRRGDLQRHSPTDRA